MADETTLKDRLRRARWRLVLGEGADEAFGGDILDAEGRAQDMALTFLYSREYGQGGGRNVRHAAAGGMEGSRLTIPEWINAVHRLFPKKTIERLERDALERYEIQEMVTNPELLKRAQPNLTLLKAILHTKHLMNQEVLNMAREIARRVIRELLEKLERPVRSPFQGAINRAERSPLKVAHNFDAKETIRRNLKHYDAGARRLVIEQPIFFSKVRRHLDKWQLIIVVDQSGSMLDSVIYSAVCASIFWGLRALKTHLLAFDTNIVDLTESCHDPLETLMKVQLGGGTDIGRALAYAAGLVEHPRRTILLLISDFYEGAATGRLLHTAQGLVESGVHLLGLAALDDRAEPVYNHELAQKLVNLGAHVGAMTPGELASWVAEKLG